MQGASGDPVPDQAVKAEASPASGPTAARQASSTGTADVGPSADKAGASEEMLPAGTAAEERKKSKGAPDESGAAFVVGKICRQKVY